MNHLKEMSFAQLNARQFDYVTIHHNVLLQHSSPFTHQI